MWIMIIKDIPVDKQHKPQKLGIYWAVPWDINYDHIISAIVRDEDLRHNISKQFDVSLYPTGRMTSIRNKVQAFVLQNKQKVVAFMSLQGNILYDSVGMGREDNPALKVQIMIGEEPVGILSYEYSKLTAENMNVYLEEVSHYLVPQSNISHEILELTRRQHFIKDAALLDGCTPHQADMVALGKDPEVDFPPPLGWYKAQDTLVEMFG